MKKLVYYILLGRNGALEHVNLRRLTGLGERQIGTRMRKGKRTEYSNDESNEDISYSSEIRPKNLETNILSNNKYC